MDSKQSKDSLRGRFLVATPGQLDPNFVQSVVLVVRHVDRGAFGVIVNQPSGEKGGTLWERMARQYDLGERPLYWGGPVSGPLMAVHTNASLAEMEILPELFFTAREEHVASLVRKKQHPYKIFLGYAGWGPDQLEWEIAQGVWRTAAASVVQAFSHARDLWCNVSRQAAESVLQSIFHVKHIPRDPLVN